MTTGVDAEFCARLYLPSDKEDLAALASLGLLNADALESRALAALGGFALVKQNKVSGTPDLV